MKKTLIILFLFNLVLRAESDSSKSVLTIFDAELNFKVGLSYVALSEKFEKLKNYTYYNSLSPYGTYFGYTQKYALRGFAIHNYEIEINAKNFGGGVFLNSSDFSFVDIKNDYHLLNPQKIKYGSIDYDFTSYGIYCYYLLSDYMKVGANYMISSETKGAYASEGMGANLFTLSNDFKKISPYVEFVYSINNYKFKFELSHPVYNKLNSGYSTWDTIKKNNRINTKYVEKNYAFELFWDVKAKAAILVDFWGLTFSGSYEYCYTRVRNYLNSKKHLTTISIIF